MVKIRGAANGSDRYIGNAAIILTVSLLACYAPARWAGKVDPASVLRP